jgi:hypothetical protein
MIIGMSRIPVLGQGIRDVPVILLRPSAPTP